MAESARRHGGRPPRTETAITAPPQPADPDASVLHVLARLGAVEHHVASEFDRRRELDVDADDWRLRGVYVSPDAVATILAQDDDRPVALDDDARAYLDTLDREADQAEAGGARLRLRELARRRGLDEVDVHLLLLAAATGIDRRLELPVAYLNDDATSRTPTVGLALRLSGLPVASARARSRLLGDGPLVRAGLVHVDEPTLPPLSRPLRAPARVVGHLLGDDRPDEVLLPATVDAPPLRCATADAVAQALDGDDALVHVHDPSMAVGVGAAAAAAEATGRTALVLDLDHVRGDGDDGHAVRVARAALVEAVLGDRVLVAGPVDDLGDRAPAALALLASAPVATVLVGRQPWSPGWSPAVPVPVRAEPAMPAQVAAVWHQLLAEVTTDGVDVDRDLAPLRLAPAQTARAVRVAVGLARAADRPVGLPDLRAGVRAQNAAGLQRLTRRLEPTSRWDDLVVPPAVDRELRLIATRWRQRDRVLGAWGLSGGAGRGRGVSAMFAGPSGTGKTLAAQVIAADLGLDLYVVDLSTVVDKYIGETSKNLERIFAEADRVNGVLLFDEADALFGKRSSVNDSKDRHANVEVAFLLQRMEAFDGVAILTSNLASNLDDAFLRRLDAIVDFPRPDPALRERLWEVTLGDRVPRADDVDTADLARRLELAGGEIRNVVLTAAYVAAARGEPVTMDDLVRAAVREHRKLQKRLSVADLGPHAHLLEEA